MLTDFYAIKTGMTQAWTADGKRLAVTRLNAQDNIVAAVVSPSILEVGFGRKKEKNISKPLLTRYKKGGFSFTPAKLGGARWTTQEGESEPTVGMTVPVDQVFSVGDVIEVRGITKGRGFAGAVKRYGFHGGPKTHGQSDRTRAVGSIGAGTTPGRVWKGKRMPGHYGVETKTVSGLVVVYVDPETKELWVSGPVPGHLFSNVVLRKTGETRSLELDRKASGLPEVVERVAEAESTETDQPETAEPEVTAEVETTKSDSVAEVEAAVADEAAE